MIYTCTLNPSIDYIMHVDDFQEGTLNRASQTQFYPGGKGINVSRVLKRLEIDTCAIGFIGGFTGEFILNFLSDEQVPHRFIQTSLPTRVNVKLKSGEETEINGPGPLLSQQDQASLLSMIRSMDQDDVLIIAGSVPSSLPNDFYTTIARACQSNHVRLVADTSGSALNHLIGEQIYLLKPNHHELGELFQTNIETKEQAAYYGKQLLDQGVERVIISMGGKGAVYVDSEQQLFATVPQGTVKNSVGAGDSVVAGFTAAIAKNMSTEAAIRYAVAAGSATAFKDDLCKQEDVEQLLSTIQLSPIPLKEEKL